MISGQQYSKKWEGIVMDDIFPSIKKKIENFIEDEEGNVTGKKLLVLGTMIIILGSLFPMDVFARHRSHRSHSSHRSHRSSNGGHSNHGSHSNHSSSHGSHVSHQSHQSASEHSNHASHSNHSNHVSHTSHSNTGSHSNSRYSAEGDVTYAPQASTINGISVPTVKNTEELFKLPSLTDINENIESPNVTPGSGIVPNIAIPASTAGAKVDAGDIHTPSPTDSIE